ncbi:MAG: ribosome small subunit-dependent GTPase A [Sphingobacteriales bacterium]|jgi:ribosome biogenesis GTPase
MQAVVYKSTGSWYVVKTRQGKVHPARIKGIFKIDGITSTNPIAVGDVVEVEMENEVEQTVMITEILDRKNYINRQSPSHRKQHHIVAANLDQCMIVATLREPRTSQGFIDRFLVACESFHIPVVIVFNKADLYRTKDLEKYAEWEEMYMGAGYQTILISLKEQIGVENLLNLLKDKVTLISGHSGVGKSTLINHLLPDLDLRTNEVSGWSGKGLHTTTFAEMFDLPAGGHIIDTPGIREFGLVDIPKQELSHYFPEMRNIIRECQFNNCLHMNEPGCAVKSAVEQGKLHIDRYISYCTILDSIKEDDWR